MKSRILAVAILFSLGNPALVLAAEPAVAVTPPTVEVAPIDVEAAAQQAVAETLPEAAAAVPGLVESQAVTETPAATEPAIEMAPVDVEATVQQAVAETLPEAAAPAPEPQAVTEAPVPAIETGAEPAAPETPLDVIATDAGASGAQADKAPCPTQGKGKGMMHRGMDHAGKKPCCDRKGKHEQVVQRLDMIEARMAKIETMLESLMQR